MNLQEILDKIDTIIKDGESQLDEDNLDKEGQSSKSTGTEIVYLLMQVFLSILRAPFNLVARYLRSEIISSIKKDAKLFAFIGGTLGVLIVFLAILWLFLSVAVGVYFQENGNSLLTSIIYSIGFQFLSIIFVGVTSYVTSRKIRSLKILSSLADIK